MSVTISQIILDAKRIANRLKDREVLGDSLLVETEGINKRLEANIELNEVLQILNDMAREKSDMQLIETINQENPQIREIQAENRELRACLEDYQRALEHIMSKYREHTQKKILDSKVNEASKVYMDRQNVAKYQEIIDKQAEKIREMAAVMQKASLFDEEEINKYNEHISRLKTENQGLREILQISQEYGSHGKKCITCEDKCVQTELEKQESKETNDKSIDEYDVNITKTNVFVTAATNDVTKLEKTSVLNNSS